LEVASSVAVTGGATVDDFDRLAEIPAFDPDRDDELTNPDLSVGGVVTASVIGSGRRGRVVRCSGSRQPGLRRVVGLRRWRRRP
jgi:hypothetical protein